MHQPTRWIAKTAFKLNVVSIWRPSGDRASAWRVGLGSGGRSPELMSGCRTASRRALCESDDGRISNHTPHRAPRGTLGGTPLRAAWGCGQGNRIGPMRRLDGAESREGEAPAEPNAWRRLMGYRVSGMGGRTGSHASAAPHTPYPNAGRRRLGRSLALPDRCRRSS